MKKLRSIMAIVLSAAMLTGCAGKDTESGLEFSDSPFSNNSSAPTSEPQADSYEELFGKYQTGSIKTSNYSLGESMETEYNGGDVELSFDMDTSGNQYETEKGFMAFVNGIPQKLSLNGGEKSELVRVSQQPDQTSTVTLSFTPTITKDLIDEKTLQVKITDIFNPSYKPTGSFIGFGNAHHGGAFLEFDLKVNSPLAVSDSALEPIKGECESVLITDKITKEYGISKPGENTATTVNIIDAQTKGVPLELRGGKLDAELLMYGSEVYNYRVYVYVNHERVKFNGGDYLETETKSGYLNVFKLELENIKERDIVYAIAVPTNSDTGSMAARKSGSVLVLDENDIPGGDELNSQPPVQSQPNTPPETSDNEQPQFEGKTNIYAYHPEGYIDDEQRYLLLSKFSFFSRRTEYHDLIIYDEVTKQVTGVLDVENNDFLEWTYGDGAVTVQVSREIWGENEDTLHYVVYNEKFEPVLELRDRDISGYECISNPRYLPSQKRWYFNMPNEDGMSEHFCTANEDFSEVTKISDCALYKYFVLDDKIVYYKIINDMQNPKSNADIFGIMDLQGNIIDETTVSSKGEGRYRLGKAGDIVYMISGFWFEPNPLLQTPMESMIFYDCKTGEQKTFRPENANEKTFCAVTPNGKYLVTGILEQENHYTNKDIILKRYDIKSGELLESEALGTGSANFLDLSVYNDRAMLNDLNSVTYMFKLQ